MCKLRMFGVWLRGDSNATYEKLARALATVGKRNIAEAMCTARGMALFIINNVHSIACMACYILLLLFQGFH